MWLIAPLYDSVKFYFNNLKKKNTGGLQQLNLLIIKQLSLLIDQFHLVFTVKLGHLNC